MKNFFLPLLLAGSFSSFAQNVYNKISFNKGQQLEITTNMNIISESVMGESNGNFILVDTYAITDASEAGASLSKAVKQVKFNLSAMGRDILVNSDNKEDLNGPFGEPVKQIMKEKYDFTIDATGKVTAVKTDEKKKENEPSMGMLGMMMPGMLLNGGVPVVGAPSVFKILPDRPISKGDTWTDSVNTKENKSLTRYIVKDITDTEILVDFTGEATTLTTQEAMGMSVDVTAKNKSAGTITIDKATGLLKQRTAASTSESTINLGGREMSSTVKTTAVTNVKTS